VWKFYTFKQILIGKATICNSVDMRAAKRKEGKMPKKMPPKEKAEGRWAAVGQIERGAASSPEIVVAFKSTPLCAVYL